METSQQKGVGWGFVGLWVEGLMGGEKNESPKKRSDGGGQNNRGGYCVHTRYKRLERKNTEKVEHKTRRMNRY